jgi:hypothetical protein
MIVNGKYRVTIPSAGTEDKLIELILWLVAQENGAAGKTAAH